MEHDGMTIEQLEAEEEKFCQRIESIQKELEDDTLSLDTRVDKKEEYWHLVERLERVRDTLADRYWKVQNDK